MDNIKIEIWKDIIGYEGYYQISNLGNVKSLNRIVKNKNGYRNTGERLLKIYLPKIVSIIRLLFYARMEKLKTN